MAVIARNKIVTSGVGTVEPYAYLTKPDYGNEEKGFGNPRGVYKAKLTFNNDDPVCQRMVKDIVDTHEAHYAERVAEYNENPPQVQRGKKPLLPYEGDLPFIDNGDGTTTFNYSCYASYQDKKTKETRHINVMIVDSKGKKITGDAVPLFIGGGSKIRIKYKLVPYSWNPTVGASVKLQIDSFQLIELATSGGGESEWDEVEGGYEAQQEDNGGWSEHEESGASSDDDEDF